MPGRNNFHVETHHYPMRFHDVGYHAVCSGSPIVITSGSLTIIGLSGTPTYSLSGENFSVTSLGGDPGNTPNCAPCQSGTFVDLSSFLVGTSLGNGPVTINGTTFTNVFSQAFSILPPRPFCFPPVRQTSQSRLRLLSRGLYEAAQIRLWFVRLKYSVSLN